MKGIQSVNESQSMDQWRRIYLMGIGGIAMGTLAGMLKDSGYDVLGSDLQVYPPMSHFLEQKHIPVYSGYRASNIREARPDAVVIGNVIRKDNPEALEALHSGKPVLSMPQALDRLVLHRHKSLVVSGTHGKSTTSGLLGYLLETAGMDPSVFVGGFINNWKRSYRVGRGPFMVLEGDEYDTAFFDKNPKFLHYRPWIAVITSIEFDHGDIYENVEQIKEAFRKLCRLIPPDGILIINGDDPFCREVAGNCRGKVVTYGRAADNDWRLVEAVPEKETMRVLFRDPTGNEHGFRSRLPGRHNALNALSLAPLWEALGLDFAAFGRGLQEFRGIKRRQEVLFSENGVIVIDDFAHHPTAVKETVKAIREFYPGKRLLALFEPRTNTSRRKHFQESYASVFTGADWVGIKEPSGFHAIPENERLDTASLVTAIKGNGTSAELFREGEPVVPALMDRIGSNDVVLTMSNGDMDGVPRQIVEACRKLFGRPDGNDQSKTNHNQIK